jgi:hypothetical protein
MLGAETEEDQGGEVGLGDWFPVRNLLGPRTLHRVPGQTEGCQILRLHCQMKTDPPEGLAEAPWVFAKDSQVSQEVFGLVTSASGSPEGTD